MATRFKLIPKRFRKNQKGATAVEFAFMAVPFFGLMFGTIDIGLAYLIGDVIEANLSTAARTLRTGEAQENGTSAGQFKSQICEGLEDIIDCTGSLKISVNAAGNAASATSANIEDEGFVIGGQNDWHFVQVSLTRNFFTPFMTILTRNGSGDSLTEYTVTRNRLVVSEPFGP